MSDIRRKPSSFEEYWLASQAWERKGLPLGSARALANAGFLSVDDLLSANDLELATIPRVGPKSLAILYGLMGRPKPGEPKDQMNASGRRRQQPKPVLQIWGNGPGSNRGQWCESLKEETCPPALV